jgi:hypothetical protein
MAEEPGKDDEQLPRIPIGQDSLHVIYSCLHPYMQVVKSGQPLSIERGLYLTNIERLRKRIADVLAIGFPEGEGMVLSGQECEIVDRALLCFMEKLPLVVPQSRHRDETIEAIKQLRQHFGQARSPHQEEGTNRHLQ